MIRRMNKTRTAPLPVRCNWCQDMAACLTYTAGAVYVPACNVHATAARAPLTLPTVTGERAINAAPERVKLYVRDLGGTWVPSQDDAATRRRARGMDRLSLWIYGAYV
jgi:hypothetical protein